MPTVSSLKQQQRVDDIAAARWYVQTRSSIGGFSSLKSDISSIESIGYAFPVVFLIVAVLMSLTAMTRMVEEERGLIGTYTGLGYGNAAIAMRYVLFAALRLPNRRRTGTDGRLPRHSVVPAAGDRGTVRCPAYSSNTIGCTGRQASHCSSSAWSSQRSSPAPGLCGKARLNSCSRKRRRPARASCSNASARCGGGSASSTRSPRATYSASKAAC